MTEANQPGDEPRRATERRPRSAEGRRSDDRYRSLFTECPVSLWEEDISELLAYLEQLRGQGIADLRQYFGEHREEVGRCLGLVRMLAVNRAAISLHEAPDEQSLLAHLPAVFTEESLTAFREIVITLAAGGRQFATEVVIRTLKGKDLAVHLRWSLLPDKAGKHTRALISVEDLTEQKRAQATLRETEANFREFVLAQPDPIQVLTPEGTILICNEPSAAAYGSTVAQMTGGNAFDGLPPAVTAERRTLLDRVAVGKQRHVFEEQFRGRCYETTLSPIVGPDGEVGKIAVFPHDITPLKKIESELRESRQFLEAVIEAAPTWVKILTADGALQMMNRAGLDQIEAVSLEQVRGQSVYPLVAAENREAFKALVKDVFSGKPGALEFRMIGLQGRSSWLDTRAVPLRNAAGEITALLAVTVDITERKETEEKLRRSEEFVRSILDTVDEGFIVVEPDYRILSANRAYCQQVGLSAEEVIGRQCFEVSHRLHRPCSEVGEECAARRVFASGTPGTALHRHPAADGGGLLYVETKAFPLRDGEGRIIAAIMTVTNITEKHLLEEERLKTQKLESIGTLAGGIAHDFNNLLQGIFGYISLAKVNLDQREKSLAMLEQAEKALKLSVNLTSQLLTFSRGGKPVKRRVALGPVIANAARFALSGSHSDCRFDIGPGLMPADADEGQIAQVIQNVVLNADQAMPLGGLVTISARNLPAELAGERPGLEAREYVEIAIRDQGGGIPEAHLPRIFDPYFTTKDRGSGLGLATSYSIVRNHDGRIEAKSTVGKGSTFVICLPAARESARETGRPPAPAAGRAARILVMDDDEGVRTIAVEMLRRLGHEAECAGHGEAAIEKYRTARDAGLLFDAVILDLTIRGGLGGAETVRRLRAIDPGVKAVVSSGYSDEAIIADYGAHGFSAFLKKPYSVEDLRQVLDPLIA